MKDVKNRTKDRNGIDFAEFLKKKLEVHTKLLMESKHIAEYMTNNPSVTSQDIMNNMSMFVEYNDTKNKCEGCKGLNNCNNIIPGHYPIIEKQESYNRYSKGNQYQLTYLRCSYMNQYREKKTQGDCIKSVHVSEELLQVTFSDIETDEAGRLKAIQVALDFIDDFLAGKSTKGLYLHGSFGVGKSFFAAAIVNELSKKQVSSTYVYVPEFFRELRSSIKAGNLEDKIGFVKETPILVLDDIGAESLSVWLRDDILGSILQYRSANGLPIIFTSNLTLREFENHLAYTHNGGEERLKAARLMQRIEPYVQTVQISGRNRRSKTH